MTASAPQANAAGHLQIALLLFPELDQLDLTGPFEVLSRVPDSTLHLVWKDREPVRDMKGLALLPTTSFAECPPLDVLVVPGGYGQQKLMDDAEVLAFVRRQSARARYTASVCTGSLVLGAAGLLRGYRATTHWTAMPLLEILGATPSDERVVVDRDRVTAGGVTSGIDLGLRLAALLRGDAAAQAIQLYMQYSPEPPFDAGLPGSAPAAVKDKVWAAAEPMFQQRLETCRRIARELDRA